MSPLRALPQELPGFSDISQIHVWVLRWLDHFLIPYVLEENCAPKTSSFLCPLLVINNNWRRALCPELSITNSLTRYFFIVRQIYEHNKCLLSSNYSSEKRYKEKRIERAEGTTTKAILLRTTSRDGAYIKVIVIRQTEYKGRAQWFMRPTRSIIVP